MHTPPYGSYPEDRSAYPGPSQPPYPPQPLYPQYPQSAAPQQMPPLSPPEQQGLPTRRRSRWPWIVIPVVVLLLAGSVGTAILVSGKGKSSGHSGAGKTADSSTLRIGTFPYINACNTFGPANISTLGSPGSGGTKVQEKFADALPAGVNHQKPKYYYGLTSECHMTAPVLTDDAQIRTADLKVQQFAQTSDAREMYQSQGKGEPLAGMKDTVKLPHGNSEVEVSWLHDNAFFSFDVSSNGNSPAPSDDKLTKALQLINGRLKHPDSKAKPVPNGAVNGTKQVDTCGLYTGRDNEAATHFVTQSTEIERTYAYKPRGDDPIKASCMRRSAAERDVIAGKPGLSFAPPALSLSPVNVEVTSCPNAECVQFTMGFTSPTNPTDVPGLGVPARIGEFGGASLGGHTEVLVASKGNYVVNIRFTAPDDWSTDKIHSVLVAVARPVIQKL